MFNNLSNKRKINYLRGCIPRKPYDEVIEDSRGPSKEVVNKLRDKSKKLVKIEMQIGRDHWKFLKNHLEIEDDDILLSDKSYRELIYFSSSLQNSALETFPYIVENISHFSKKGNSEEFNTDSLKKELISNGNEVINKSFSEFGSDIWKILTDKPTPRFSYLEDKYHVYIEFWCEGKYKKYFHERLGEEVKIPRLRKYFVRVHIDDGLIEIRGRRMKVQDRSYILSYIESLFNDKISISNKRLEISDGTIECFESLNEFQQITHASKKGIATSKWTSDRGVRSDNKYPKDRENNYMHLRFDVNNIGNFSVRLNVEENTFRVFKYKIAPQKHRKIVEFIKDRVHECNN